MNINASTRSGVLLLSVGWFFLPMWGISANADEVCDGDGPYVCVKRTGQVVEDTDFRFDFTDSDNPDVEFITGASDWEVWSQVGEFDTAPANLGDLTVDPSSVNEDFDIKIRNGTSAGAVNVLSINLDGTVSDPNWVGYSSIGSGSKISGDLSGDLVLVADSVGSGGSAQGFVIAGDVTGDITMSHGAGFTIQGRFGVFGGSNEVLTVDDIVGGSLTIEDIQDTEIFVLDKISNGELRIGGKATAFNEITIEAMENGADLIVSEGTLAFGIVKVRINGDLPSGCTVNMRNAINVNEKISVSGNVDGTILVGNLNGWLLVEGIGSTGVVNMTDLNASMFVSGATASGSEITITKGIGSSGRIVINGSTNGDGGTSDADGDINIGPGLNSSSVFFDGKITIVKCPGSAGGDLGGTITVTGCHATGDPLDICIGGDIVGGAVVIDQNASCTNQVDAVCLFGQQGFCACVDNDDCDDGNNVCTFDICQGSLCFITPELHGDTTHDNNGLACGPDDVVDTNDVDAMGDAFSGTFHDDCEAHKGSRKNKLIDSA